MSIRSMTGFGRESLEIAGLGHTVEIRAVNHRFLDVKIRVPRAWTAIEPAIKAAVSARLQRGRIDVTLSTLGGDTAPANRVEINWPLAEAVRLAHAAIADKLGIPDACDTATLAAWPGVLVAGDAAVDAADAEQRLLAAVERAIDGLVEMRTREGEALAAILDAHLAAIEAHRAVLAREAPEQARAYEKRFEQRLREMLTAVGREVDEGRVLHEVGVFAEKTDVAEELARLGSHVEQARALLTGDPGDGIGRRLDFICQEMLREANTIGSKAQAIEMTRVVVDLKSELERLREQAQNVE
ncbi:MAG: YicC family protein [Myxococcales bacterium]|nr:YicC family protein [Myxococcales bacterium]